VATMIGCLPTQALAFSPVSVQTHATQAIAFGWKLGLRRLNSLHCDNVALVVDF